MNMNETIGKYAKWCVRVKKPQIQTYTFPSRGQQIEANTFSCILVGDNPSEYMIGCVPFEFRNSGAAKQALARFVEDTVGVVSKPVFDSRAKVEFNGSPMKLTLLLRDPTNLRAVAPTETIAYNFPVMHVIPPTTLAYIVSMKFNNVTASGKDPKKKQQCSSCRFSGESNRDE